MTNHYALTDVTSTTATPVFTLLSSDTLFVSRDAAVLNVGTGPAVRVTGTSSARIAGEVYSATSHAIDTSAASFKLTVLETGSLFGESFGVNATGALDLSNAGFIGGAAGLNLSGGFRNQVFNQGVVQGSIQLSAGVERTVIENGGRIVDESTSGTTNIYVFAPVTLINSGYIDGANYSFYSMGNHSDLVVNTGVIEGDVVLGDGNDTFDGRGGTLIASRVYGFAGDDTFIIDASAATGIENLFGDQGTDTLDLSQTNAAFWVDFEWQGIQVWTSGGSVATGANANTPLARVSDFERILGSAGSDTIYGNASDNVYRWTGNAPDGTPDFFDGRGGSDTIEIGSARPSIWADLNYAGVQIWTSGGSVSTGASASIAVATVRNVENIMGTSGSDDVFGNAADNTFASVSFDRASGVLDRFDGRGGSDTIDFSRGSAGAVWVSLSLSGVEVYTSLTSVATSANANTPYVDLTSVENVIGSFGSDFVIGDGLNNTYGFTTFTPGSPEYFHGMGGIDTFDASRQATYSLWIDLTYSSTEVWTSLTATSTNANSNTAVANLESVENIVGSALNDYLRGDAGASRIEGGAGNDDIGGGGGWDTFVFRPGFGADTLQDFDEGTGLSDVIAILGFGTAFDTFAEVQAMMSASGSNTLINFGSGNTILVIGAPNGTLVADDFVFV